MWVSWSGVLNVPSPTPTVTDFALLINVCRTSQTTMIFCPGNSLSSKRYLYVIFIMAKVVINGGLVLHVSLFEVKTVEVLFLFTSFGWGSATNPRSKHPPGAKPFPVRLPIPASGFWHVAEMLGKQCKGLSGLPQAYICFGSTVCFCFRWTSGAFSVSS